MAQATLDTPTAAPTPAGPKWLPFNRNQCYALSGMYGFIALLHAMGWGFFLYYQHKFGATYATAGGLAYSFGLRHAFDADHISAIDDTTRYLMQRGKKPVGVGFFFSLGHSTIVVCHGRRSGGGRPELSRSTFPGCKGSADRSGSTISGTFLMLIAILDFFILIGLIDVWKKTKSGEYQPAGARRADDAAGFHQPHHGQPVAPVHLRLVADVPGRDAVRSRIRHRHGGRACWP